ncbi:hypothetical protein [Fervidicoccus fontis]|uniref:hypothetical protein n=1 Tax=Fervidicoccus fontis TaxID=683846 RepID=UPI00235636EF|nr:hypothetical protein [Fervidicoccus fontis]
MKGEKEEETHNDEIEEIIKRMDILEMKVSELEKKIEELREKINEIENVFGRSKEASGKIEQINMLLDKLRNKGYLKESEDLARVKDKDFVADRIKKLGAIEVIGTKDRYLIYPRKWKEFLEKLSSISDSDPSSAAEKIGDLKELFFELLKEGLIYFDAKNRKWKSIS